MFSSAVRNDDAFLWRLLARRIDAPRSDLYFLLGSTQLRQRYSHYAKES